MVRSQQSLNEQHALLEAVQRLEEKLRERAAKDLQAAARPTTAQQPTENASSTKAGRSGASGMQTGAGASPQVVNLNYNGVQLGAVNTDASGRQALQKFMDALTNARGTSR